MSRTAPRPGRLRSLELCEGAQVTTTAERRRTGGDVVGILLVLGVVLLG
jgi:hypothetical protein